jgi:hypothetical protein
MGEVEPVLLHPEQPGSLGPGEGGLLDAQPRGGRHEHDQLPGVLGGGEQQQPAYVRGLLAKALQESPFEAVAERQPRRIGARRAGRGELCRQLHQGQRVAGREVEHPTAQPLVQRGAPVFGQQRPGGGGVKGAQRKLRQPREVHLVGSGREDHPDPVGLDPARDEQERVEGGAVQPVRVVHQTQHRLTLGLVAQQAEDPCGHQEPVLPGGRRQSQRGTERRGLRDRQPVEVGQHGSQHAVEPRERELRLGLDAADAKQPQAGCLACRIRQQRGLAQPGVAAQDQRATPTVAGAIQQPVDRPPLLVPPVQHDPTLGAGGIADAIQRSWHAIRAHYSGGAEQLG